MMMKQNSHIILHLPQLAHNVHRIRLPCRLLHRRVLRKNGQQFIRRLPIDSSGASKLTVTRMNTLYCYT